MDNLSQFQSEGNVNEEEWAEEALLLKKKDSSQGIRPLCKNHYKKKGLKRACETFLTPNVNNNTTDSLENSILR